MIAFIETIPPDAADGRLKTLYDRVKGPEGRVDNILVAHSLRPHTLEGHMALYKYVLHHHANTVPKWLLEAVGVYVSLINGCAYCVDHHFEGMRKLLDDDAKAQTVKEALAAAINTRAIDTPSLSAKEITALDYAARLTKSPTLIAAADIKSLREAGWDDGEILEINQVAAYFAYANRTVLGLGVTSEGDALGLSPNNSDDENDWGHR